MSHKAKPITANELEKAQMAAVLTANTVCEHGNALIRDLLDSIDTSTLLKLNEQMNAIPEKGQAFVTLAAIGWSQSRIAKVFGVTQQTVCTVLGRYDPERIFRMNPRAACAIRSAMTYTKSDMILFSICPEDLAGASLRDKAIAYDKLVGRAQALAEQAQDPGGDKDDQARIDTYLSSIAVVS